MIVRIGNFQAGLMLAAALSVSLWSAESQAYTPEQQQACTGDALRLCGSDVPDVDRITACMIRNKSQLSPPCRAYFRSGPEPSEVSAVGRPLSIKPAPTRKPVSAKPAKPKKPAKPDAT